MVDRSSALETNFPIGKNNYDAKVQLQFKEIKDLQILQVATWPDTLAEVGKKITNHLNLLEEPFLNKANSNKSSILMRIEPLKWWIINSDLPILSTDEGTTLDLSHSYTCLEIKGEKTIIFLNKFLPLDLREKSFPTNSVATSAIHHVSVKIWRNQNSFQLFIPRGFALSLWEIFLETATQFNYEVN